MSDTEQLFVLAGVWVAIAAVIARFISGWPARIVVFTLLVGIPFWELPYGYYNFRELCKSKRSCRSLRGYRLRIRSALAISIRFCTRGLFRRDLRESRSMVDPTIRDAIRKVGECSQQNESCSEALFVLPSRATFISHGAYCVTT